MASNWSHHFSLLFFFEIKFFFLTIYLFLINSNFTKYRLYSYFVGVGDAAARWRHTAHGIGLYNLFISFLFDSSRCKWRIRRTRPVCPRDDDGRIRRRFPLRCCVFSLDASRRRLLFLWFYGPRTRLMSHVNHGWFSGRTLHDSRTIIHIEREREREKGNVEKVSRRRWRRRPLNIQMQFTFRRIIQYIYKYTFS